MKNFCIRVIRWPFSKRKPPGCFHPGGLLNYAFSVGLEHEADAEASLSGIAIFAPSVTAFPEDTEGMRGTPFEAATRTPSSNGGGVGRHAAGRENIRGEADGAFDREADDHSSASIPSAV